MFYQISALFIKLDEYKSINHKNFSEKYKNLQSCSLNKILKLNPKEKFLGLALYIERKAKSNR
jgi:hypothetical protein